MTYVSIGDQSQIFLTRRFNTDLKAQMQRLSGELASGRLARPATSSTADTAHIHAIARNLVALRAYKTAAAEADHFYSVAQHALDSVQKAMSDLGPAMLTASSSQHLTLIQSTGADAAVKFAGVVGALNARAAERGVFSGTATDRNALASGEAMLDELRAAVAGESSAAGIMSVVDSWFDDPGGGFETFGFLGSAPATPAFRIGEGESAKMPVTAADESIRRVLKGFALGALVGTPGIAGDVHQQAQLAKTSGEMLLTAESSLAAVRAGIGAVQGRIDAAVTRNASETSALELAQAAFIAADPYRTATEFEAVRQQIESLYSVTARLSRLTLTEYLR